MKCIRFGFIATTAIVLTACGTISLELTPRTQGEVLHGVANRQDHQIVITGSDRTYTGHWTYIQGGSVSTGIATTGSAIATGTAIGISLTGTGNIVASSNDGHHLHCAFNYSQLSDTGAGICENDEGITYDLQIVKQYQ